MTDLSIVIVNIWMVEDFAVFQWEEVCFWTGCWVVVIEHQFDFEFFALIAGVFSALEGG